MVAKSIFGLVVRLLGLTIAAYGLYLLLNASLDLIGDLMQAGLDRVMENGGFRRYWLPYATLLTAAGVVVLRTANAIVRYTYRPSLPGARCHACGYDLRATPGRCPECGAVPENA